MHVKKRRLLLPHFETCSVALFASLALYGPLQARAQATAPAATSQHSTASTSTTIPPNQWTAEQISQAFKQGDKNSDGRLSRDEAALWSGLSRRFDQVDTNKDGSISSAEFDEALK